MARALQSFLLALQIWLTAIVCLGGLRLFDAAGPRLVPHVSGWQLVTVGVASVLLALFLSRKLILDSYFPLVIPLLFASTVFFTDYAFRRYAFFGTAAWRVDALILGVIGATFVTLLSNRKSIPSWLFLFAVQIVVAVAFMRYTDGRLLFSDDHPSFLYRFQQLYHHFPYIPFYETGWNAGYSAREYFASGMLNVFALVWPIIYFVGDITTIEGAWAYNLIIPVVFIGIIPWSVYLAARVTGFSSLAATFSGLLSLGPSLEYFEWLLKFGTIGFACSIGLLPLAIALAVRLALMWERPSWRICIGLVVAATMVIFWSLSGLAFIPVALYAIARFKTTFSKERIGKIIAFIILFSALNLPWMKVFFEESKVFSFVSGSVLPGTEEVSEENAKEKLELKIGWTVKEIQDALYKSNPILLLLFIPGLLYTARQTVRMTLGLTIGWLFFVAFFGDIWKPQLELRRMVLPAMFLMCIPVGEYFARVVEQCRFSLSTNRVRDAVRLVVPWIALILSFGLLLSSTVAVAVVYQNRSDERFVFAPKELAELTEAIKKHGGEGRTMFLGFILHELGAANYASQDGGHVAPLAEFTGKELYASDYYHSRWTTVDPIPKSFRDQGEEGIEKFLNLVNVTAVVTFKREWVEYCRRQENYREISQHGRFRIFERIQRRPSFFLEGGGEVLRSKDGLVVIPQTKHSIIKYRFLPKLQSSVADGVTIEPVFAFNEDRGGGVTREVNFIKLTVDEKHLAERTPVVIGYRAR